MYNWTLFIEMKLLYFVNVLINEYLNNAIKNSFTSDFSDYVCDESTSPTQRFYGSLEQVFFST